jgi:EAL domain-containing protein (putative c-di-GMP-specific phosphodiesterase class I)
MPDWNKDELKILTQTADLLNVMSCALCAVRKDCKETEFCLLPATEDMGVLLADVLEEHRIPFERHRNLFGLPNSRERASAARVIALLRQLLSEPERQAISVLSGEPLDFPHSQPIDEWWKIYQTDWFADALASNAFEIWFQPIVDPGGALAGGAAAPRVLAHECLIRLNAGRPYNGAEIVEAARVRNEIHAFDSHARSLSIRSAAAQSRDARYFINFMPSSIYNPELCMRSTLATLEECGMKPENITFEVVESDHVRDPAHLRRICDYYRSRGFGFALDDLGTGSNSLQMMCDLRPDYIKLDKSLISGVEQPMYAATIRKLVELANRFGTVVIAEGVERQETMENLWLLGVQWMQGYLFGRPAPRLCEEGFQPRYAQRKQQASATRPRRAASRAR